MVTVILIHGLLVLAFGVGVLRASGRRSLSWVGGLLIAISVVGFPTHTIWAMSSRDMETGFNDTMHIILSAVFSALVIAAMALSAAAYPGWFGLYSLATIAVVVGFGMASAFAIQGIEQNDTPWVGGFERINAYAYFAWLIVLAVTVMRREAPETRSRGERGVTGAKLPT
jgi:magnesium-transporting ATPase (P-type)